MIIYTLYVKTHRKTGLKYLGQTTKNPLSYKGSGIDWKRHLKENGNNVDTEILYQGTDREEMKHLGRYYSKLWEVSTSKEWSNRIPETGGGSTPSIETRKILREKNLGKKKPPRTQEHKNNLRNASVGVPKPKVSESLKKWYSTNPDRSGSIDKQRNSLKEWYENNPGKKAEKGHKISKWCENNQEKLAERAQKISDTKIIKQEERYKTIVPLVLSGKTRHQILKQTGCVVKNSDIEAIKNKSHRLFFVLPEFKHLI